jgi:hypothetical protein
VGFGAWQLQFIAVDRVADHTPARQRALRRVSQRTNRGAI